MPEHELKTLAKEEDVKPLHPGLLGLLEVLINTMLPGLSRAAMQEILEMRCQLEDDPLSMIDPEVVEAMFPQQDQKSMEDSAGCVNDIHNVNWLIDWLWLFSSGRQEHKKKIEKDNTETGAFRSAVRTSGRGQASDLPPKKQKNKERDLVLAGKRVLDLQVARGMAPSGAYLYETTDGLRMRVFYGKRRRSTSSMISIGRALAVHHCLKWAWQVHEADGGSKNPYDLSKIKTGWQVLLHFFYYFAFWGKLKDRNFGEMTLAACTGAVHVLCSANLVWCNSQHCNDKGIVLLSFYWYFDYLLINAVVLPPTLPDFQVWLQACICHAFWHAYMVCLFLERQVRIILGHLENPYTDDGKRINIYISHLQYIHVKDEYTHAL